MGEGPLGSLWGIVLMTLVNTDRTILTVDGFIPWHEILDYTNWSVGAEHKRAFGTLLLTVGVM